MKNSRIALILVGLGFISAGAIWQVNAANQALSAPPAIQSPPLADVMALDADEKTAFFNQRLALHCNTCHSHEMIEQQQLTLTQWQAEVQKMINWGSTLPKDYAGLMAEHLNQLYPKDHAVKLNLISPENAIAESLQADQKPIEEAEFANRETAKLYSTNCLNCHGPAGRGAELGIRLTNRPMVTHPSAFHEITRNGRGIMPAFGQSLKNEEIEALRRWLLARSFSFSTN
jgi:mono/diheme cytochrome c family protein